MAHPENVTPLPVVPGEVTIGRADGNPRFTPRELELIKDRYGRSMSELMQDDSDDKFVTLGWLKLRRQGYQISFDDMQDIVIELVGDETPDPTNTDNSDDSPRSVTPGG